MIFVTIEDVDTILGVDWTTQDKKADAVLDANIYLDSMKFCSGLDPIDDAIKRAGAYLSRMSSGNQLFVTKTEGTVTEKSVKADTVQVTKKFKEGLEVGISADMQRVNALLKPFLCNGVGKINGWVCK